MRTVRVLKAQGAEYEVRYTYNREDGTVWYVLKDKAGFPATDLLGDFGDEWPAALVK